MLIFNGLEHGIALEDKLSQYISQNPEALSKKLLIIQIGDNATSQKYVALKASLAQRLGVNAEVVSIDALSPYETIRERLQNLLVDKRVTSAIVQLPLPNPALVPILELIPADLDVDLLSSTSKERFYSGDFYRLPPTVRATKLFLDVTKIGINGLKVICVGNGDLIGKPISFYLEQLGASVTVLDKEDDVENKKLNCDLVVLGTNIPKHIKGEQIASGTSVIDFGSISNKGKMCGNLDMGSNLSHLGVVSPSPKGMGPLVVRFLLMNHLRI